MRILSTLFLAGTVLFTACQQGGGTKEVKLTTEIDSVSYSMGVSVGENIKQSGLDSMNTAAFATALADVYSESGETKVNAEEANKIIQGYFQGIQAKKGEANIQKGQQFLEQNKAREEVQVTQSGLQYEVIKEGDGPKPSAEDKVTVHYHGTLLDGSVFDSSIERGQPASFPVNGVIPGWTEALQMMSVGSKWKIYVPSELAYGARGAGGMIGPNETLIFEVELLSIDGE